MSVSGAVQPATSPAARVALGLVVGVALFAAAPLTPWPTALVALAMLGVLGAALNCVSDLRRRRREEILARLAIALARQIGSPPRASLTASRWSGRGAEAHPGRIVIDYDPAAASDAVDFEHDIKEKVTTRLGQRYALAKHDQRKCRLFLRLDRARGEHQQASAARARADRAVRELMGPTARIIKAVVDEDGHLSSVSVTHSAGARLAGSGYRARVERTISAMHQGRWRAKWDLENDAVTFEVRPTLPGSIWLPPEAPQDATDLLANYDRVRIPLGVDEDSNEITWAPAINPQFLITGGTGTGKTSTTHGIVGNITQYGWPVWVLDGKQVEFLDHRTWPNVQIVATTIEEQVALIYRAHKLMETRYQLMKRGVPKETFEPLALILDEWSEFVAGLTLWYAGVKVKGDPTQPPTLSLEASLARLARTARIHLVKSMQRPDVKLLGGVGGEVRSNFGQRASVGRLDPQGALMMWDSPVTGVTIPRGMRQRGITTNEDGAPTEVQFYRFPSLTAPEGTQERVRLDQLRPAVTRHQRLLYVPPDEQPDLDGDGLLTPTFHDYATAAWVPASERPDLDPLNQIGAQMSPEEITVISSTMAAFTTSGPAARGARVSTPANASPAPVETIEADPFGGYENPESTDVSALEPGDLIEVEHGRWAVVEEIFADDLDPDAVAISWIGLEGEDEGLLSVDVNADVNARRVEAV